MSKQTFRAALLVVLATLAVAVAVAGWYGWKVYQYPDVPHRGKGVEVQVTIERGMSFPQIAQRLAERGVIDRPFWFRVHAMRRGATTAVKPGAYVLADNLTPRKVLDHLVRGVPERTVSVTLPEGQNMLELFELLEEAGVARRAELLALARDRDFLREHSIAGDSVDGLLFPDTYNFVVPTPPRKVLQRLINAHRTVWNQLAREHARTLGKLKDRLGWSDRDVLVLASIVEKEAVDPAERPRIAQVFVNRMTSPTFKPKRLETDPTIRYGCLVPAQPSAACAAWIDACVRVGKPPGCERLRRAQLDDKDNPYNTYQHEGLPPGPIGNPGKASIAAAMKPDGSDYFYFVAKDARTHVFSRTYAEHARAVDKYQK